MKLIIELDTDNAAFDDDLAGDEVSRILKDLARSVEGSSNEDLIYYDQSTLRDTNGNTVGKVLVRGESKREIAKLLKK